MRVQLLQFSFMVFAMSLAVIVPSHSQTITTVEEMDFGLALDRGGTATQITLGPDGSFSTNNGNIEFVTNPEPAEIAISGAIGFSSYTVAKTNPMNTTIAGPGVTARLNNFTFSSPDGFAIDGAGTGTFFMGGRLTTQRGGGGSPYPEATFTGDVEIEVTFIP